MRMEGCPVAETGREAFERAQIVMPWSPLDALLDCLPEVRKAGKVLKDDDVLSVQKRMADIFLPIVKRIGNSRLDAAIAKLRELQDKYAAAETLNAAIAALEEMKQ